MSRQVRDCPMHAPQGSRLACSVPVEVGRSALRRSEIQVQDEDG
jgi:hypothetical protein